MSAEPYTPGYIELIKDENVAAEFERLAAYLAGMKTGAITETRVQAGLVSGQVVTIKAGAAFRLYKSPASSQTLAPNTATEISWDVEEVDTDNFFPGSGTDITITVPGSYLISIGIEPEGTQNGLWVDLLVNDRAVLGHNQTNLAWIGQFVGGEVLSVLVVNGNPTSVTLDTFHTQILAYQLQSSEGAIIVPGTGGSPGDVGSAGTPPTTAPPSQVLPNYLSQNWWSGRANGQDLTYDMVGTGINNALPLGTPTVNNTASSTFTKYTSGAAVGAIAGVHQVSNVGVQTKHGPVFIAKILTGASIAGARIWIGLTETVPTNADEIAGAHYVMFRYSSVVPDPGWVGVVRDGTAALQSQTGKVADILAATEYLLKIRISPTGTTAYFSVDGGAEISVATNLPPTTINLGFAMVILSTAGGAKEFSLSRHFCTFGT